MREMCGLHFHLTTRLDPCPLVSEEAKSHPPLLSFSIPALTGANKRTRIFHQPQSEALRARPISHSLDVVGGVCWWECWVIDIDYAKTAYGRMRGVQGFDSSVFALIKLGFVTWFHPN
jgi:hypothetical protein